MMPTISTKNETETFYIDFRGFLYLKFISDTNYNFITVEQLNKYLDITSKICNKKTPSILIDLRDVRGIVSFADPCFKLLAKDIRLKTVCNKIAIITNSLALSLKLNNYITMYRPDVLTKVYNGLDDGINFCKN